MPSTRTTAARLYHELFLEVQHLKADISYEAATSFCDDCPCKNWDDYVPQSYSEIEFGVHIADSCCKQDDDWRQGDYEHIAFCNKLMAELKSFAGSEEIAVAQAKVAQSKQPAAPAGER